LSNLLNEELPGGGERIVVTEIPFMVNKSRLIEQIAQLVREKKLTDIRDLRDESDRDGLRVVIELKRDAIPRVVLNRLYKHTQMQTTFGTILLALVDGVPKVMALKEMLLHFIDHRHVVVVRRSEHELRKAKDREHILEGLKIAVDHIDEVIKIIRGSEDTETASIRLRAAFELSERQAEAILNMRLARLTGLEMEKLEQELTEVRARIGELDAILASRQVRMEIIVEELNGLAEKYGDDRRTEILSDHVILNEEDLIAEEDMVITVSHHGYIKRIEIDTYRAQRRGGRGLRGMDTKEEDWVEHLFVASTHDYIMIFTRSGQCYWLKVWEIPPAGRQARGKPIVNLVNIASGEEIAAVVPIREFSEDLHLLFSTRQGQIKKTKLSAYGNIRAVGLNAINIREGDDLIDVRVTTGSDQIILGTRNGMAIRFPEKDARPLGRVASGVRGIDLSAGDEVVGMVVLSRLDPTLLVVTEGGMGKRTNVDAYRVQRRGGKGVINIKTTPKTGKVVTIKSVIEDDELMFITRNGVVNRQRVAEIRTIGRATQGVRLVNLDEGDRVMDVARVIGEDGDDLPEGGLPEGQLPIGDLPQGDRSEDDWPEGDLLERPSGEMDGGEAGAGEPSEPDDADGGT
jgi:DNA gyrase subunit A